MHTLIILLSFFAVGLASNRKLLFVCVVYRHGDRAPVKAYPTDPYGLQYWPNGWGQLTNRGKLRQYELGVWLRKRYKNFLPTKYKAEDIYVRSTNLDRAIVSAMANLAGLYKPAKADLWHKDLEWQPIPVHTVPENMDVVVLGSKYCPRYEILLNKVLEELRPVMSMFELVFREVAQHAGLSNPSSLNTLLVADTLGVEKENNLELPDWTKSYYPHPLMDYEELYIRIGCYDKNLKRLKCGPLLREIMEHFEGKMNGSLCQKMWQYSAHDQTVADLLQCLNVYDGKRPPYAAAIILELYEVKGTFFVEIIYKKKNRLRILAIPHCDKLCPFERFKLLTYPVIPDDWEKECQNQI